MFTNDSKWYVLLGSVVAFLIVVFGIIYFWGPKERVSVPVTSTSTTNTPVTNEPPARRPASEVIADLMYAPYLNPEGKFTFDYPLGWEVVQNPGGGAVVMIKNPVRDRVSETVTVKADIAVIGGTVSNGAPKTCAGYRPIDPILSCAEVVVSGVPSLLIDLETPLGIGDALMHVRQLLVVNEKVGFAIQTRAYTDAWSQYEKTFTKVLESFRLLP